MRSIAKIAAIATMSLALLSAPAVASAAPVEHVHAPDAVAAQSQGAYSVHLDRPARFMDHGSTYNLHGSATGYVAGNWVNIWVREAGSTQWIDAGGRHVANAADFTVPMEAKGHSQKKYEVQISIGAYPQERYSEIHTVTMRHL